MLAPAHFVVSVETAMDMLQNELQLGPACQKQRTKHFELPKLVMLCSPHHAMISIKAGKLSLLNHIEQGFFSLMATNHGPVSIKPYLLLSSCSSAPAACSSSR